MMIISDGCPKTSQSGSGNMVCLPLQAADESAQDAAAWWNLPECTMDFVFSCVGVYESWMVGAPGVLCFWMLSADDKTHDTSDL